MSLHLPIRDVIHYSLSEPAYVAIFAVTRGQGVRLVFPYFESQVARPGTAGLNQESLHGASRNWGYAGDALHDQSHFQRSFAGNTDAYFIIASKEPLPLEGILQSPPLLRSLLGDDVYRANHFPRTWDALADVLVAGLPENAWAFDVYLTLRAPNIFSVAYNQEPTFRYCGGDRSFYVPGALALEQCRSSQWMVATTFSRPAPESDGQRRQPPGEPRDRDPSVPFPLDGGTIRSARSESDATRRERTRREVESNRQENRRESDPKQGESPRPAEPQPAEEKQPAQKDN